MQDFVLDQLQPAGEMPDVGDLLAVVESARAEADAIREAARAEGFAAGQAEGFAAAQAMAQAQLAPAVQALGTAAEALAAERGALAEQVESRAVELALELAEKVVAGAIAAQPERVLDVVRGALRAVVERERLVIQVNPEDLEIVREGLDELAGALGGIEHVEVQEERRVQRGGAVIRTAVGEVDAKIRTKLDRAREAVLEGLGS
jgi:flagellar assembly protein FliH